MARVSRRSSQSRSARRPRAGRLARLLGLAEPARARRGAGRSTLGLVGLDLGGARGDVRASRLLAPLLAALVVALGIASLRTDLLRVRYALAEASLEEERLLEQQRSLTAQMRRLRDPVQLAGHAKRLGFVRPEQLIALPRRGGSAPEAGDEHGAPNGTVLAASETARSAALDRP